MYLEVGRRRTFAGALGWPGWCRSGRDEASALAALLAYGERYRDALGPAARGLRVPRDPAGFEVVERLPGDATTDFGAPAKAPLADDGPVDASELRRLERILLACWAAFDRAASAARGSELRRGPRGGGRDLDAIVRHVLSADRAYLTSLGARSARGDEPIDRETHVAAALELLRSRSRGSPPPRTPRSGTLWSPRYFVRRSAWHLLDHAWEIEDRATPLGP
ncbi:MAG TPA: hypothetical protein VNO79_12935 [Actinomycetota bacterium]|nr:hypothetical protein [Actinomycetota bacterium]